jgi:hypothetical protein
MSADAALMCVGGGVRTPTEAGKRMHKACNQKEGGKSNSRSVGREVCSCFVTGVRVVWCSNIKDINCHCLALTSGRKKRKNKLQEAWRCGGCWGSVLSLSRQSFLTPRLAENGGQCMETGSGFLFARMWCTLLARLARRPTANRDPWQREPCRHLLRHLLLSV